MRVRESITTIIVLAAGAFACGQQLKAAEAEATYLGRHLQCVDRAKTREESRACRDRVDEEWGIHHTVTDGGRE